MSEQEKAVREMTFNEFAPICIKQADEWIKRHPQGNSDWNEDFAMIAMMRNCIDRGLRAQQERQNPKPLTCEGCEKEQAKENALTRSAMPERCKWCTRHHQYSDRYEPKGEHHE